MATPTNAAKLAARQSTVIEKLIQSAKRYLDDFTTENRAEITLDQIIGLAERVGKLSPTDEQRERMWRIVEVGQQQLNDLVPFERVSTIDDDMDDGEITGELSY